MRVAAFNAEEFLFIPGIRSAFSCILVRRTRSQVLGQGIIRLSRIPCSRLQLRSFFMVIDPLEFVLLNLSCFILQLKVPIFYLFIYHLESSDLIVDLNYAEKEGS